MKHRGDAQAHCALGLVGVAHASENQDRRRDRRLSQLACLIDGEHREPRAAGTEQRVGYGNHAVPVRVGLDHSDDVAIARQSASYRNVAAKRFQVDFRQCRRVVLHSHPLAKIAAGRPAAVT